MAATQEVPVKKSGKTEQAAVPAAGASHPLVGLRGEVDRVFDDFFRGWPSLMTFPSRFFDFGSFKQAAEPLKTTLASFAPRVDVSETAEAFEIEAELPGVDEKDINVALSDGVLTIKGEKKVEREEKKKDYYLSERSYGTVQRSFELPDAVEVDKIFAEFKKGVLTITLPKSKEAKSKERKIAIKSA